MEKFSLKAKEDRLTFSVVSIFVFVRALIFFSFDALEISRKSYELTSFSPFTWVMLAIFAAFAVLIAIIVMKLFKSFDGIFKYLSVAFLADILFFITQNNAVKALSVSLGILLMLLVLKNHGSVLAGVMTMLYAFFSSTVSDTALFSYSLLAVLFYFALNLTSANKLEAKNVIFSLVSISLSVGGYAVNKLFFGKMSQTLEKLYRYNVNINYTSQDYYADNMYMLIFVIPILLVYVWFLFNYRSAIIEAKNRRRKKDPEPVKNLYVVPVVSVVIIALNIAALFFCFNEVYLIATLVPLLTIVAMCIGANPYAKKALEQMNDFVSRHTALSIIAICVISVPLLYFISDDADIRETIQKLSTWFKM